MSSINVTTPKCAQLFYSDNFKMSITDEELVKIAKKNFSTHQNTLCSLAHRASQFCLIPSRKSLQLFSSAFQSRPGRDKHKKFFIETRPFGVLKGVVGLIALVLSSSVVLITAPIHLIALAAFKNRPLIGYIDNSEHVNPSEKSKLEKQAPLHIRTHNLGFVPESMGIIGDLRPVCDRAHEVAEGILNDQDAPDVMFFQETFHEDGMRILSDKIKEQYPYIIHSVLPTTIGFNSGSYIASKYPLKNVEFHRLEHFLGPERLTPRGLLKVKIETEKGPVNIYSTHAQALVGKDRAEARFKQLEQIKLIMDDDFKKDGYPQLLVGDLNTSTVTEWGESNEDNNNPERAVQNKLKTCFQDLFLKDHDEFTGVRKKGKPEYLSKDNERMNLPHLQEPSASWYVGPLDNKESFIERMMHTHKKEDRKKHNYGGKKNKSTQVKNQSVWGTPAWRNSQPANTARLDYVLVPKKTSENKPLDGSVEIRRIFVREESQSAPTDHLPVDAKIWLPEDNFNYMKMIKLPFTLLFNYIHK